MKIKYAFLPMALTLAMWSQTALQASSNDSGPLVLVVDGYDDNDDVWMAAKVGRASDTRMQITVDQQEYEIYLTPSSKPIGKQSKIESSPWLTFSVGRLKAGSYRVLLNEREGATLRIARSLPDHLDDFIYPTIDSLKTKETKDGRLTAVLNYSLDSNESLKDIRVFYQHNSVILLPTVTRNSDIRPEAKTARLWSVSYLDKRLPPTPFLLLARGKAKRDDAGRPISGDKLIVVE